MRALRFLPLVFVVGAEGFAMFMPYALAVWGIALVIDRVKGQPQPLPAVA